MSGRSLLALAASVLLAACGGRAEVKAPTSTLDAGTAAAVKEHSEKAHAQDGGKWSAKPAPAADDRVLAVPTGTSVDEVPRNEVQARRGKVLGTDPEGCTWVEGEASVAVGEQDTRNQVRAAAVEQARAAAVQDFLGVDVKSRFMDFQQEGLRSQASLTESILQTTRNGRILKEVVKKEGYVDIPGCPGCRFGIMIHACVIPVPSSADKGFRIEVMVAPHYKQGEEAKIRLTATRDCSIYLYDIYGLGSQEKTALVLPNEALSEKQLKAGESWEYPDDAARRMGVKLVAEMPLATDEISAETIRVVATKVPLPKKAYDPSDGGWFGVLRRLNRSKTEWADDAMAFTILKQ